MASGLEALFDLPQVSSRGRSCLNWSSTAVSVGFCLWPAACCMSCWAVLVVDWFSELPVPSLVFLPWKWSGLFSVRCRALVAGETGKKLEVQMTAVVTWHLQKLLWPQRGSSWPTRLSMALLQKTARDCHAQLPLEAGRGGITPCVTGSYIMPLRRWMICISLLLLSVFTLAF